MGEKKKGFASEEGRLRSQLFQARAKAGGEALQGSGRAISNSHQPVERRHLGRITTRISGTNLLGKANYGVTRPALIKSPWRGGGKEWAEKFSKRGRARSRKAGGR